MDEEYLDIIDEQDNIVGKALRADIYKNLHLHRIVHVLVFNSQGKLLLQKRSAKNKFLPLHWGTSSGGHVQSGESYQEAGLRELEEELGITGELKNLGKNFYQDNFRPDLKKYIQVFKITSEGPFILDPNEGEEVVFLSLEEIQQKIKDQELFMPELLFILQKHLKNK